MWYYIRSFKKYFMVKFWQVSNIALRSSYRMCSIKNVALKNLAILTGKHLHWSLFLINLEVYKPATLLDVFRDDNQRRIENPMKHLKWSFLQKYLAVFGSVKTCLLFQIDSPLQLNTYNISQPLFTWSNS